MESGKFYSQLVDADTGMEVWESREYEDMEDAYSAGKYEWEARIEAREQAARSFRDGDR